MDVNFFSAIREDNVGDLEVERLELEVVPDARNTIDLPWLWEFMSVTGDVDLYFIHVRFSFLALPNVQDQPRASRPVGCSAWFGGSGLEKGQYIESERFCRGLNAVSTSSRGCWVRSLRKSPQVVKR
jgi:hypothetical protein